jgi:hypothetical protein
MAKRPFSRSSSIAASVRAAFEFHVHPEPNSGCWLWAGPVFQRGGYGCFTMRPAGIIQHRAHRLAYELYCSPITSAQHVLHTCDNRVCVNPEHLFIGDQPANMADKVQKGRQDRGEDHGRSKLKAVQILAIREDGRLHADIAAEYGVSFVTISDIKRRRSWAHL